MSVRNAVVLLVISWGVNLAGAHVLDMLGLIEGLLSPHGARLLLVLPVAVLFFVARFCALFVAPGLLLAAIADGSRIRLRNRTPQLER